MSGLFGIKVETKGLNLSYRDSLRISTTVLTEIAKEWHEKFLPLHFEESATSRYGYARRSADYLKRKMRQFGHQKPLVFSEEAYHLARIRKITANSNRAVVELPRKLNRSNPKSRAKMSQEIRMLLPSEAEHLRDLGQVVFADELAKNAK